MIAALATLLLRIAIAGDERLEAHPAPIDELVKEIAAASPDDAARESALAALFRAVPGSSVEIAALPAAATGIVEKLRAALREELENGSRPPPPTAVVESSLTAFDARAKAIGRNVVAKLPGRTDRQLVFAAHVDAAEGSRGVFDDWSGCVLVAELLRAFRASKPEHTLVFVGFAGQELGCVGSGAWAESLSPEELAKIDALVTVEDAGLAAPWAWWSGSSRGVVEVAVDAAKRAAIPFKALDFPGGSSDSLRLRRRDVPVIALFGLEPAQARLLHGPGDLPSAIDPGHLAEMQNLLIALVQDLDRHAQPLVWDYVKDKLHLGDAANGRPPTQPTKVDLAAAALAPPQPAASKPNPPRSQMP